MQEVGYKMNHTPLPNQDELALARAKRSHDKPVACDWRVENNTFDRAIERLSKDMGSLISYCEATKPRDWYLHKVRNKGNTKNCLYGHVVNWYYGKDWQGDVTAIWDAFEEVGTSFYVYPINDGTNPEYPQKTARERCIAYLKNVQSGKELWSWAAMERDMAEYQAAEKRKQRSERANTKSKRELAPQPNTKNGGK